MVFGDGALLKYQIPQMRQISSILEIEHGVSQ
nr:MAG TPA: hypothetical protein [Caudoviricetes sp.]